MSKTIAISLPEWIINEIIGETGNKSQRVQELLVKGHMAEKMSAQSVEGHKGKENALIHVQTDDLRGFGGFPKYSVEH